MIAAAFALTALMFASGQRLLAEQTPPRITNSFEHESLGTVLDALAAECAVEFVPEAGVDLETPVNAHVMDLPLPYVLSTILAPLGLEAIEDGQSWRIREKAEQHEVAPTDSRHHGATPELPAPTRSAATEYEPRSTPATGSQNDAEAEERDEITEVIWPEHMGAGMAAMTFGGGVIEPGMHPGISGMTGTTTGMFGGTTGGFGTMGGSTARGGFGQSGYGHGQGFGRTVDHERSYGTDRTSPLAPAPDISDSAE